MSTPFPQIRAAAIDERTHNIYYRQTQLEALASALTTNISRLSDAIANDYGHNQAEIAVELYLAIGAIRNDYATLVPKIAQEKEYLLASGKDAGEARRPVGVVYIEPCVEHTLFYSVVVPLSAAIAAGNCVIVLLESNLRTLSSLLRDLLTTALDQDTFAVASERITDPRLLESAIHVNQVSTDRWPRANQLSSHAGARTVAVVDRTGDVKLAARELVAARFSFGGRSSYAPDIVFVNEFVKQEFLQAVVSECVNLGDGTGRSSVAKGRPTSRVNEQIEALRKADPELRVVLQESKFAVVELTSRNAELLAKKRDSPVMVVHAMRSLDDVIDTTNNTGDSVPSLAAYHFSDAASAKYLTQFIESAVTFVNHIPRNMLVGPAFPACLPVNPEARYSPDMFQLARPAFSKTTISATALDAALSAQTSTSTQKLMAEATAPLALMKRNPGGGVGFFEQGFLMNAALLLTTTLSVSGFTVYWLVKNGRRMW
ncbi:hypothetical protein LTR62_003422 [Meristemomyces frigidus]|uniref:Aldehyde dehydrogenase domain-containing protein n=1 Tax=Meristemomyces frigidus TaxID=1508187 RepID=A0AAN7YRV1_9PEZI|nr:hypothetical protein LTR62_003422 [Meristemomyces frigidus]